MSSISAKRTKEYNKNADENNVKKKWIEFDTIFWKFKRKYNESYDDILNFKFIPVDKSFIEGLNPSWIPVNDLKSYDLSKFMGKL